MQKIKVAIIGASGYAGGELLSLLLRHGYVEIVCLTSRQYAGYPVEDVFSRLKGTGLVFEEPDQKKIRENADVAFLALPHGVASEFAERLCEGGVKVLDISADFRLSNPETYASAYGAEHPSPELLQKAVYGLPERNRHAVANAELIACPGCYPTGAILPLAPLLQEKLIDSTRICITSMSGVTGAGRKVRLPFLFGECNESMRPYKVVGHRHVPEIEEQLCVAAGKEALTVSFVPHLMPVSRGIITTVYVPMETGVTTDAIHNALMDAYGEEEFVRLLTSGELPDTKNVTMTNVCEISATYDQRTGQVILNSAIDNLTKGAAGQAIQCMNVTLGVPETAGLT